ncbi:Secretion system C-terminal sorting domain [Flavobacteriaceae bacterium]
MKTIINKTIGKIGILFCLVMLSFSGFSQTAHFTVGLANVSSTSTTMEMDVTVTVDAPSAGARLNIVSVGVNFNTAILNGGTPCTTAQCGSWAYIAGTKSSELAGLGVTNNSTVSTTGHLRIVGGAATSAVDVLPGTYTLGRYRFTNTTSWTAGSNATLALQPTNTGGRTNTVVSFMPYGAGTPTTSYSTTVPSILAPGVSLGYTAAAPLTVMLNANICATAATASNETAVSCFGINDGAATVTLSPTPTATSVSYTVDGGTAIAATLVNGAFTISGLSAGSHTVAVINTNCANVSSNFTISGPAELTNSTTASECETYTWAVNGQTYTSTGTYTGTSTAVGGCSVAETLNLTITPNTSSSETVNACDSYTWALNNQTYTTTGTKTFVDGGCHTYSLVLKISPSSTATVTETACGSYIWPLTGETYDQSGTYTFEDECAVTNLTLTITPNTTVETTELACTSYTWSENGETYITSGDYTHNDGCHSATLHLTINQLQTYYVDADGDGFGSNVAEQICSETAPQGFTTNHLDCDDTNANVSSDVVINTQPVNTAICTTLNSTTTYSVEAEGSSLAYQWQYKLSATTGWANITSVNAGAVYTNYTTANLTVKRATTLLPAAVTQYRVIVSGGTCAPQTSNAATITIETGAIAKAITGAAPVCVGGSKTLTYGTGSTGDIQWQSSTDNSTWTNEGAIINSTAATNTAVSFIAADLQETTWYRVVNQTECSPATSPAVQVVVNQPAFVGTITATTEEVCTGIGTSISLDDFTGTITWQKTTYLNGVVGTAYTAVANSLATPITNGGLTLGTGNLTASTVYRAMVTSGVCPAEYSNEVLITVSPLAVAKTITGAGAICNNGQSKLLTYVMTGSIGNNKQWQSMVSNSTTAPVVTDANWADIANETGETYTAAPTATTWYRMKVTSGVCNPAYSVAVAVTVGQPTSIASIVANTYTVCTGGNTTITLNSVGTIAWSKAPVTLGVVGTFAAVAGNTTSTLATGALTATSAYKATVSSGICSTTTSDVVIITVSPISVAKTITGAAPICSGTSKLLTYVTTGSFGDRQWQFSTTSATANDFADIDGETAITYSAAPTATTWYRLKLTSGPCSAAFTPAVQIIVNEAMSAGTISGGNVTVCKTLNATTLTLSNHNGAIQWQSAVSTTAIPTSIASATSATYTTPNLAVNTYYTAKVSNACGSLTTTPVLITVSPASVPGTITGGGAICLGTSKTLTLVANVGTPQWQSSTDAGANWDDISGQTANTYTASPSVVTLYRVKVTNGACPSINTVAPVTVTVDQPVQAGIISNGDITVCSGIATDLTLADNSTTGVISWSKSINGTVWTAVALASNSTLNTGALIANTWYKAKITNGTCSQETASIKVTVTPVAKAGTIATSAASVCLGGDITFTISGHTGSVQWQSLTSATNLASATPVGNGGTTYTLTNASGPSLFIRAYVTSASCTNATTALKTIVVNPTSVAGTVSGGGVVCENGSGTLKIAGNVGTIQWQSSSDGENFGPAPTGLAAIGTNYVSGSTTATAATYLVNTITAPVYFRAKITSGLCSSIYSNVVQYTIGTEAAAGTISASATTLCAGSAAVLTLSNSIGSITWQKTTVTTAGVLGTLWADVVSSALAPITNNGTTLATGNLTASTAYRSKVTIGSCDTEYSEPQVITVNPTSKSGIVAVNTTGTAVCSGGSKAMKVTGNVGTIQWQSSSDGTTFADVAGATTTPYTFTDIAAATWFRVVATSGICAPALASNAVAITLSIPAEAGTITGTDSVCTTTGTTLALGNGVGVVTWQKAPVTTGVWAAATGGTTSSIATGSLTASTKFRATFTSGACVAYSNEFTVTVSAAAKATTIAGHTGATTSATAICTTTTRALSLVGTTYVGSIQWQSAVGTTAPATSAYVDIPNATAASYLASSTVAGNVWYRVRFTSSPCSATALSAAVNVWFKTCNTVVNNDPISPVSRTVAAPFSVKAYPNPFGEYFTLGLETSKSEMVMMSLYDMTGKLLENREVEPSNIDSLHFGQNLPAGIYNMIVVQGSEVKTVRVVKK